MKYMLLIYNQPSFVADLSDADRDALFADVDALMAELTASGELVGGHALADPSSAKTVRSVGRRGVVTDGPFIESKEQFAGYVLLECDSLDRAVEIAHRWPDTRHGGALEVREVMDDTTPET